MKNIGIFKTSRPDIAPDVVEAEQGYADATARFIQNWLRFYFRDMYDIHVRGFVLPHEGSHAFIRSSFDPRFGTTNAAR